MLLPRRSIDGYQTQLQTFLKFDILVICPHCSKKAIVKPGNFSIDDIHSNEVKVICLYCGFNKLLKEKPTSILYASNTKTLKGHVYITGGAIDPFFHLPVWLQTPFEQHVLWAYNMEHLNFLQSHIEAALRERNGQERLNRSIGSRLPKWMTARKNREAVLKKMHELQQK